MPRWRNHLQVETPFLTSTSLQVHHHIKLYKTNKNLNVENIVQIIRVSKGINFNIGIYYKSHLASFITYFFWFIN